MNENKPWWQTESIDWRITEGKVIQAIEKHYRILVAEMARDRALAIMRAEIERKENKK